jgi:hypothetical protein
MKTWYLKVDVNTIILDAIEYPFEGYIEVQLPDTQLPAGINGGWYTWNGTAYVEDLTKKPVPTSTLEERITANKINLESTSADLMAFQDLFFSVNPTL